MGYLGSFIDDKRDCRFVHLEELQKEAENTNLSQARMEACRTTCANQGYQQLQDLSCRLALGDVAETGRLDLVRVRNLSASALTISNHRQVSPFMLAFSR